MTMIECNLKKRMKLLVVGMCIGIAGSSLHAQQEPMYSQYMFNMMLINPAYAGSRTSDCITALYRNQWVGIKGAPKTTSVYWDKRQSEGNVGYGLGIYNDQLGIEKTSGIQAFYSYHIPFEDNAFLAFGVSGGVLNYKALYSELDLQQSGDPVFQTDVNGWLPTAGFGVLFATPDWYVGLSVPALLHTKKSMAGYISQANPEASNHYYLTGGYVFGVSDDVKIKPSFLLRKEQGAPFEFDINTNVWFMDMFSIGASYRNKNAVIGMMEIQVMPELRIGYAYDYTTTSLNKFSSGTHELMLRVELPSKPCPWCDPKRGIISPRYY